MAQEGDVFALTVVADGVGDDLGATVCGGIINNDDLQRPGIFLSEDGEQGLFDERFQIVACDDDADSGNLVHNQRGNAYLDMIAKWRENSIFFALFSFVDRCILFAQGKQIQTERDNKQDADHAQRYSHGVRCCCAAGNRHERQTAKRECQRVAVLPYGRKQHGGQRQKCAGKEENGGGGVHVMRW